MQVERTQHGNYKRKIQIGKDRSANTHREIHVGNYKLENINRKTGINKIQIGKYKSGSPSLYPALPRETVQNATLCESCFCMCRCRKHNWQSVEQSENEH